MLQCIIDQKNEMDKTKNYLKMLDVVDIELSLLSWIYADVVTEVVAGVHFFVVVKFDELILWLNLDCYGFQQ